MDRIAAGLFLCAGVCFARDEGACQPAFSNVQDANAQNEFYNYTGGNLAETGNDYGTEASAGNAYLNAFYAIPPNQLYYISPLISAAYNVALNTWINARTSSGCGGGSPTAAVDF